MGKTYKVFISQATSGVPENDIITQHKNAVALMTDYLKDYDADISVEFIETYTKDGLRKDCPVRNISPTVDVDIICFVGDLAMTASECSFDRDVCERYNIPYVHFTDFDIAEFVNHKDVGKLDRCLDGTRVYKRILPHKLFTHYIVDTKNTPKYDICRRYFMRADEQNLKFFINDYIYMVTTLIESGLIDNLYGFSVIEEIEDDMFHSDRLYRELIKPLKSDMNYNNTLITLCDSDGHAYKELKAAGFIDMSGTWLGYESAAVMLFTRDNTLLRYIYELSFMLKSRSDIANMNLPADVIGFHANTMTSVLDDTNHKYNDFTEEDHT